MSFGHCSCPDCGTTLRIRDRTFVGRQVPCPECHVSLIIELDQGTLAVRKPPTDKVAKSTKATAVKSAAVDKDMPRRSTVLDSVRWAMGSPLVMAWALALAVMSLVIVAMLRPAVRFRSPGGSAQPEPVASNALTSEGISAADANSHQSPPETISPNALPAEEVADATIPANVTETPPPQPSDVEPVTKPVEAVAVKPPDPAPPPTPKVDLDASLKQRLLSFKQNKPVSRRELIELLEELLGAPIRFDREELGANHLDKLVTVELENTTVGGVLKAVVDPVGWEFVAEQTQLRLRPKSSDDGTLK